MKWLRKADKEAHWKAVALEIDVFVSMVNVFRKTAPGVRYYVNCTPEEDAKTHRNTAEYILEALRCIKNSEIGAYKTIVYRYKDDIRDAIAVYRESKGKA